EKVAIGNPASVPVGRYSQQALEAAGLWSAMQAKAISTQNVRQSLDYVARGEVEAGFVYATDASVMQDKVKVAFEVPLEVKISYPIAQTADSANAAEGHRYIAYARSPAGQAVLARHGVKQPSGAVVDSVWIALALSPPVAGWATATTLVLGVAVGYLLARKRFPGRELLDTLLTLPMVMPPTVLGYYLLVLMGKRSASGAWLHESFGINLIFTWQGAVIAASVV